jgi:hypothetical protein
VIAYADLAMASVLAGFVLALWALGLLLPVLYMLRII